MRLSINRNDPGYRSPGVCKQYRVFLDGKELFDVETADEEKGFVIRTWPTRHPVTRKTVMQRSGLIRGVVNLFRRDEITFDEVSTIDPAKWAELAAALRLKRNPGQLP
jgi:hypothetical protein